MTKHLTREQAVQAVGADAVSKVDAMTCDFTDRVTEDGTVEFRASIAAVDNDGDEITLRAYYYQDRASLDTVEHLDLLDWTISHYTAI